MNDKELLELAAKAAGLDDLLAVGFGSPIPYWLNDPKQPEPRYWNPLTDDGDALRLAVKLGLFNDEDFVAELKAIWMYSCTDYYAATRRAIVRAAYEIGKAMP